MKNRKIPKYNPMSKEFQEEAKRLGLTGNQLIQKYVREEKFPDPTVVDRECNNHIFQNIGYKDKAEYIREWRHSNGILSMEENTDCANYLGIIVAERQYGRIILPEMLRGIEQEMPYGNPYYDFLMTGK